MATHISARPSFRDEKERGWQKFLSTIQPYQNIIFFVLLLIALAILLILWRDYRYRKKNLRAWEHLFGTEPTIANFQNLVHLYSHTEIIPFVHYRLGNAYYESAQYEQAKNEYQYFLAHYPDHPFRLLVESRLKDIEINYQWQKEDEKRYLSELKANLNLPVAIIKTNRGDVEVELYEDDAPNTVANFISLAEKGVYNQTPFSEINPNLGLCLGTNGYPLYYTIKFEKNNLKNREGCLGMMRECDPENQVIKSERAEFLNSATSRFYICLKDNPELDGKYTVFGRVIKGMEIVRQLKKGDEVTEILIAKKRAHEYKPDVIKHHPKPEYGPPLPP